MKFQKSFTLIASLLISVSVFSQDYDPRIRPALKASCDCFENASQFRKQNLEEHTGQCILEGMIADQVGFTSYFNINFNTSTEKDFEKMGEEFGVLLAGYCPSFALLALEYGLEEESGSYDKDLNIATPVGSDSGNGLYLGDGSGWKLEGVEGTDDLLDDLCDCITLERPSFDELEISMQNCMMDILPNHMATWLRCMDADVLSDEDAMLIASHDLGVAIGMKLSVECAQMYDGLWDIDETTGTVTIPMTISGSTFTVPVILNDALKIDMLFDSGAADVSISSDVFLTLVRTGTIEDGDILGEQTYTLADGSTVEETQINLRSIELGGQVLTNVRASVSSNLDAPLLLGQSVMSRFGTITLDYNNEEVILSK